MQGHSYSLGMATHHGLPGGGKGESPLCPPPFTPPPVPPPLRRKEEKALQRSVGINGFSDMALLLSSAPRDLVELLRINTVIRSSSSLLVGGGRREEGEGHVITHVTGM